MQSRRFVFMQKPKIVPEEFYSHLKSHPCQDMIELQDIRHEAEDPQTVSSEAINALYDEGKMLLCMGKYEEALQCYDRLLEISPSSKKALGYKGLALFKLKRHAEASQCYEKALTC